MDPAEYAGIATATPGWIVIPSREWLLIAELVALAWVVALIDGWMDR